MATDAVADAASAVMVASSSSSADDSHCPLCEYYRLYALSVEIAPTIRSDYGPREAQPSLRSSQPLDPILGQSNPRAPPFLSASELLPCRLAPTS